MELIRQLAKDWGIPPKLLRRTLWKRNNREFQAEYIARYREQHPEETKAQRLKDWQTFKERNPERWREINRLARKRYCERMKLRKAAEQEALRKAKKEGMHYD